jgi:hypothetical protein
MSTKPVISFAQSQAAMTEAMRHSCKKLHPLAHISEQYDDPLTRVGDRIMSL